MKRKKNMIEKGEDLPFRYPWIDPEEEAVWLEPRVPAETILLREGLSIFNVHRS